MPDITVGAPLRAWPESEWVQDTTQITGLSNTTPAVGSPVVATQFTAPTTGRVLLIVGFGARDTNGEAVTVTPEVYVGPDATGTQIIGSADDKTHGCKSCGLTAKHAHWSRRSLLSGLTPDALHYARLVYYVTGGTTAAVRNRDLGVIPAT